LQGGLRWRPGAAVRRRSRAPGRLLRVPTRKQGNTEGTLRASSSLASLAPWRDNSFSSLCLCAFVREFFYFLAPWRDLDRARGGRRRSARAALRSTHHQRSRGVSPRRARVQSAGAGRPRSRHRLASPSRSRDAERPRMHSHAERGNETHAERGNETHAERGPGWPAGLSRRGTRRRPRRSPASGSRCGSRAPRRWCPGALRSGGRRTPRRGCSGCRPGGRGGRRC